MTMTKSNPEVNRRVHSLVHYLKPAIDDLREMNLSFESYLLEMLEMLILSLREKAEKRADRASAQHEAVLT
jgi:hypothetical protein